AGLLPRTARRHPGRPGRDVPGGLVGGAQQHDSPAGSRHPPRRAGDQRRREA
ncbi:MAG: Phosphate transport system regulatory protein PhoU, partial [uncultured Friedmanniella sp.]